MKKIFYILIALFCALPLFAQEESPDYTQGVFILNEDWYGHENSSLNFLSDEGLWYYNAYQKENPGYQLGCTSQFGAIYGDKLFIVSKQEQDPGTEHEGGGRFIVADAKTLKRLYGIDNISVDEDGKSNADGRAFLGVNKHKGYISTSNGIYIFDIDKMEITGKVDGSGNPEGSGYGSLYRGQVGTMLRRNEHVYAVHQSEGLLIIDAETDELVQTIQAPKDTDENGKETQRGFGSVVISKDGYLWLSVALNTSGGGAAAPYILKLDPVTQDTLRIAVPDDIYPPANSWYAWTADGFCSSMQHNCLYWNGGPNSWFSGQNIFKYDIDKDEFSQVLNLEETTWTLYGTGFRPHPITDNLYCFYFHEFLDPTHRLVKLDNQGNMLDEYPMIDHYWFPALPIFPDNHEPVVSDLFNSLTITREEQIYLGDKVSDEDNMDAAIVKEIVSVSNPELLDAIIRNDSLLLTPKAEVDEAVSLRLKFNSNGKTVMRDLGVNLKTNGTGMDTPVYADLRLYPNPVKDKLWINASGEAIHQVDIYNVSGRLVHTSKASGSEMCITVVDWPKGIYLVKVKFGDETKTHKLVIE